MERVNRRTYSPSPPSPPFVQAMNPPTTNEETERRDQLRQVDRERRAEEMERQVRRHEETIRTLNRLCQQLTNLQTESTAERIRQSERINR